jgi:hypothetical protein
VWDGLEKAAVTLGKDTAVATHDIVQHKYGDEAAAATREGLVVAGEVGKAAWHVNAIGVSGIVRRTAAETAVHLVQGTSGDGVQVVGAAAAALPPPGAALADGAASGAAAGGAAPSPSAAAGQALLTAAAANPAMAAAVASAVFSAAAAQAAQPAPAPAAGGGVRPPRPWPPVKQ